MNISRLDSVATPAGHIHRTDKNAARAAVETAAALPASAPDHEMSPRLANLANKVDERIANAVGSMKLSQRQLDALEDAQTKFHSMMERLDAAFGSEDGVQGKAGASGALANILDLMAESVGSIIQNKDSRPTQRLAADTDDGRSNRLRAGLVAKPHASKIDKLA